jgi:hypothetical protein
VEGGTWVLGATGDRDHWTRKDSDRILTWARPRSRLGQPSPAPSWAGLKKPNGPLG